MIFFFFSGLNLSLYAKDDNDDDDDDRKIKIKIAPANPRASEREISKKERNLQQIGLFYPNPPVLKSLPLNPPPPHPQKNFFSAEEHLIAEEEKKNLLSWEYHTCYAFFDFRGVGWWSRGWGWFNMICLLLGSAVGRYHLLIPLVELENLLQGIFFFFSFLFLLRILPLPPSIIR